MNDKQSVRADKWLWAARFFKTRSLATEAVNGGKVHLNGVRIKPARAVRTGDRLQIKKGEQRFEITVTGISERRGPAEVARTLYVESEESIRARQQAREERRLMASPEPSRRPDKRSRRQIRRLKG